MPLLPPTPHMHCHHIITGFLAAILLALHPSALQARDAAFMTPNASGGSLSNEALRIEPKSEVDLGETTVNVTKRTTIFFVNQTTLPVTVEKISLNGDGNVRPEIATDDCSKQKTIAAQSRCSVEVSVTPSTAGAWSVDVLMTHNGAGRITRAKLSGKTSGNTDDASRKETGFSPSTKETSPINFGDIEAGNKVVRSTLMVNDSPDPITIYSIDVIEAGSDLTRNNQGCAVDMELRSGESCPITLVWSPTTRAALSTDLIIRHSGRVGFVLIPVRGVAKGEAASAVTSAPNGKNPVASTLPLPHTPEPVSSAELSAPASGRVSQSEKSSGLQKNQTAYAAPLRLIGTVGSRAIFVKSDGSTLVASVGDNLELGDKEATLLSVGTKSADISLNGEKKTMLLQTAQELVVKAQDIAATKAAQSATKPQEEATTKEGKK